MEKYENNDRRSRTNEYISYLEAKYLEHKKVRDMMREMDKLNNQNDKDLSNRD